MFLCSDDNDTKCSKLLKASLRGTSGYDLSVLCMHVSDGFPKKFVWGVSGCCELYPFFWNVFNFAKPLRHIIFS